MLSSILHQGEPGLQGKSKGGRSGPAGITLGPILSRHTSTKPTASWSNSPHCKNNTQYHSSATVLLEISVCFHHFTLSKKVSQLCGKEEILSCQHCTILQADLGHMAHAVKPGTVCVHSRLPVSQKLTGLDLHPCCCQLPPGLLAVGNAHNQGLLPERGWET